MNPILSSILRSWEVRPVLLLLFFTLGLLYALGWRRLRTKSQTHKLATTWRLAFYLVGLLLVTLALMSPLDVLGGQLFYMHMIQHLLLTMFAAPMLMLANPMPFILWGLPVKPRRIAGTWLTKLLHRRAPFRHYLRVGTTAGICWLLMVIFLWGWHDPQLYNAALQNPVWHDLEHASFFLTALLYWWHVTGAGPRIHKLMSRPARVAYLLAGVPTTMAPGIVISFAETILYTYYETVPRLPPPLYLSVANDQILGGIIMWVPGSMMFIIAALVVIARWLQIEESQKRRQPHERDVVTVSKTR